MLNLNRQKKGESRSITIEERLLIKNTIIEKVSRGYKIL